jgi:hypothetical protein
MLRWLSASLMLVACLSLACLSGVTGLTLPPVSRSDTSSGWVRMGSCGGIQASASLAIKGWGRKLRLASMVYRVRPLA